MSILKPSKHTNLHYSIVNISAVIIKVLQENGIIGYDDLLNTLTSSIGKDVNEVFLKSLNFLFILQKIEYIEELDSIRLNYETV